MTHAQSTRRVQRIVEASSAHRAVRARRGPTDNGGLTVWGLATTATPLAIELGVLGSVLGTFGGEGTRFFAALFSLGLVAGIAAAMLGLVLGGRLWAAVLVATPALIVGLGTVFDGGWTVIALLGSPVAVFVGIGGVLVTAREAMDRTFEV